MQNHYSTKLALLFPSSSFKIKCWSVRTFSGLLIYMCLLSLFSIVLEAFSLSSHDVVWWHFSLFRTLPLCLYFKKSIYPKCFSLFTRATLSLLAAPLTGAFWTFPELTTHIPFLGKEWLPTHIRVEQFHKTNCLQTNQKFLASITNDWLSWLLFFCILDSLSHSLTSKFTHMATSLTLLTLLLRNIY